MKYTIKGTWWIKDELFQWYSKPFKTGNYYTIWSRNTILVGRNNKQQSNNQTNKQSIQINNEQKRALKNIFSNHIDDFVKQNGNVPCEIKAKYNI